MKLAPVSKKSKHVPVCIYTERKYSKQILKNEMSLPNQIGQHGCQTPTRWCRLYRSMQIKPDRKKGHLNKPTEG